MPAEHRHILGLFEKALHQLKLDVTSMAAIAVKNVTNAIRGMIDRNDDLCNRAIADDTEVDSLETKIDREGMEIIMKFSPVAADLRRVISTMKVSSSLERVSDHAVSIAKRGRQLNSGDALQETHLLDPLITLALASLNHAVKAFNEDDLPSSLKIADGDPELETAHRGLAQTLTKRMEEDPAHLKHYVELMFVTRFIVRIGDQASNIAEDAVYCISAYDIRHGGARPQT
ncbi:MAG: phosphate signaling complex protein PhoU [Verrucomicrobiales bacterium]|nr:phosphate signaling complex protein PhoU [Verrucomicrobiales bacterium]